MYLPSASIKPLEIFLLLAVQIRKEDLNINLSLIGIKTFDCTYT